MGTRTRIRTLARRQGFDLYQHMAGGRLLPMSVQRLPILGPLERVRPGAPPSFEVELEKCTSFVGFSYSNHGWNPHVATLREYIADRNLRYEDSSLHRVHAVFTPRTLQDLFIEDVDRPLAPLDSLPAVRPLFRYIWAINPSVIRNVGPNAVPRGHHYFGPLTPEKGRAQFERLLATFHSVEREGYRPEVYGRPKGYFMVDGSSYRFVVGSGNHRLAVLTVLGRVTVEVGLNTTHPAVIQRSRLDSWTKEAGGPFDQETAYALFDKLISEDGASKARNIGVADDHSRVITRAS
jgi:hypothetical protein